MKPSLVEILISLEGAKVWAQGFAQSHPEHYKVVGLFMKDLDQIGREFHNIVNGGNEFPKLSWHGSKMDASLPDLFLRVGAAIAFARLISERHPEYTVPMKQFEEEVVRVKRELIKRVGLQWDKD